MISPMNPHESLLSRVARTHIAEATLQRKHRDWGAVCLWIFMATCAFGVLTMAVRLVHAILLGKI